MREDTGGAIMRFRENVFLGGALFFLASSSCAAVNAAQQAAGRSEESVRKESFEPLDRWRAAVLNGDKTALAALYVSVPGAYTQTRQGKTADPNEEPEFWSQLRAAGLTACNPKILETDSPQADVVQLVLRIDLAFHSNSGMQDLIVSATQVWVRRGDIWGIWITRRSDPFPKPAMRLPEPAAPNPNLYPAPEEAQRDLDAALAAAKTDHKRVIVVFGGNWCYDCHVLDATFRSKQVAPLVEANYHLIHVNVGEFDRNKDLAKRFEVPLEKGVPALAVLDSEGTLVTSQKQGEFESAVKIGMGDVTAFLERWKPPAAR